MIAEGVDGEACEQIELALAEAHPPSEALEIAEVPDESWLGTECVDEGGEALAEGVIGFIARRLVG